MLILSLLLNTLLTVVCVYLYNQSRLDSYTELFNKAQFNQDVQHLKRKNDVVVIIDIDKFKHINDVMGHAYGDEIIKLVSKTIKSNIRSSDRAYRIGGDEFAILCSCTQIGGRIQSELRALDINVSIGLGGTYEQADAAMYADKSLR